MYEEKEIVARLDKHEHKLEQISNQIMERSFQRLVNKQPDEELNHLKKKRGEMGLDPAFHEFVQQALAITKDPLLYRRLQVWKTQNELAKVNFHPEIMELTRKIDDVLVTHQYLYKGDRLELGQIRNIVKSDPHSENRRHAWQAYEEISTTLQADMLSLFKWRNELAQQLGFDTYVDLVLHASDLNKQDVTHTLTQLMSNTQDYYNTLLQEGASSLGIDTLQPWDVQYVLDQTAGDTSNSFPREKMIPSVHQWANSMGIDLQKLGLEFVFTDIPYNGLCMSLNRNSVKVLGNPKNGYSYYRTSFHEMGHALHGLLNKQEHFGLRREPSVFNEGMAETFGYITHHPEWIQSFGLNEEEAKRVMKGAIGPQYHYIRQRTAFCLFEYACYEDPTQNVDQLLGNIEHEILGGEFSAMNRWAANAWYVNFPVYWQNYVLADVIASQIHHHLEQEFGALYDTKEAFEYVVKHYIEPGGRIPWKEKIEKTTGKALDATALTEDLMPS